MEPINSHCSYCGSAFDPLQPWPRTCSHCGNTSFLNPIPVVVVLIPVGSGVLIIRRAIEPGNGKLALPGGYVNLGETWQEAGAREVLEETGLVISPDEIHLRRVQSAPNGTIVIVGQAQKRSEADLPVFTPNDECSERMVVTEPAAMAFRLHDEMVRQYLFGTMNNKDGHEEEIL